MDSHQRPCFGMDKYVYAFHAYQNFRHNISITTSIKLCLVLGMVFGLISGIATLYFTERFYRPVSLEKFLMLRLAFTLSFLIANIFVVFFLFTRVIDAIDATLEQFLIQGPIWVFVIYLIIIDFGLALFGQMNLMLGQGIIMKIISGKFYKPQEEERIFMFLDLQASTTLAEK